MTAKPVEKGYDRRLRDSGMKHAMVQGDRWKKDYADRKGKDGYDESLGYRIEPGERP